MRLFIAEFCVERAAWGKNVKEIHELRKNAAKIAFWANSVHALRYSFHAPGAPVLVPNQLS